MKVNKTAFIQHFASVTPAAAKETILGLWPELDRMIPVPESIAAKEPKLLLIKCFFGYSLAYFQSKPSLNTKRV